MTCEPEDDGLDGLEIEDLLKWSSFGPTQHLRDQVPDEVAAELNAKVWEALSGDDGLPGESSS